MPKIMGIKAEIVVYSNLLVYLLNIIRYIKTNLHKLRDIKFVNE